MVLDEELWVSNDEGCGANRRVRRSRLSGAHITKSVWEKLPISSDLQFDTNLIRNQNAFINAMEAVGCPAALIDALLHSPLRDLYCRYMESACI